MAKIFKTFEEITDFNSVATAYLQKRKLVSPQATLIKEPFQEIGEGDKKEKKPVEKTKLDSALIELLFKQIAKKVWGKMESAKKKIIIFNALCDPNTKELLILDKAVPQMGLPAVYKYSADGQVKMEDDIEKLLEGTLTEEEMKRYSILSQKFEIHTESVPENDMPELTNEEKEAFKEYIIIEPKK